MENWSNKSEIKVVCIGDSGVGKTSIVQQYCRGKFTHNVGATIGAAFVKHSIILPDNSIIELQIWDTAGQERFQSLTPMYYRGAKIILIIFDVTDEESYLSSNKWHRELLQSNSDTKIIGLIGNKCDMKHKRVVSYKHASKTAEEMAAYYFECSAKTAEGIHELFESLTKYAVDKGLQTKDSNAIDIPNVEHTPNNTSNRCC